MLRAAGLLLIAASALTARGRAQAEPQYGRDVRPILAQHCFKCHGPDAAHREADLRLDARQALLDAYVLDTDTPADSVLLERLLHEDAGEVMPPPESSTLSAAERDTLRRWILDGARYEAHWAFVPPVRAAVPETGDSEFVRNPIDAFVLTRMRAQGLEPSAEADRATLIRRLSLDLTGLPPRIEDVAAFVADDSPTAYADLLDRLFASPHYGERMALPWLDAARYADSNGYQHDGDRYAWPWRDWLIRSLNANTPLDELVVAMLAGDRLPQPTQDEVIATAFLRHHAINDEGGAIAEETRFNYVVDRANTVATVFLGLTVGCAQCHDHKFDPVSQEEYFRFFAFFDNVAESGRIETNRHSRYHRYSISKPWLELGDEDRRSALAAARAALKSAREAKAAFDKAPEAPEGSDASAERQRLQQRIDAAHRAVARMHEAIPLVMVMRDRDGAPRETRLRARGAYDAPVGEALTPGVPAALGALPADAPRDRLGLARWLVAPDNPLFARVAVNRLWQTVFGRGLVTTPGDFGVTGRSPTHPQLLDWLAVELVESGYDLGRLHRMIVSSATYRQSARVTPEQLEVDPQGTWLARSPRYRLSSAVLRDQALAAAGLLDRGMFGPPVYPYHPDGLWADVSFDTFAYPHGRPRDQHRRSLYGFWRRTVAPPAMFDSANRIDCIVQVRRTNTPLHALVTLNETTFVEAARGLATRAIQTASDEATRLDMLLRWTTARSPSAAEGEILRGVLARERARYASDARAVDALLAVGISAVPDGVDRSELAAWTVAAQLVLNLDEVLCRP